jgi:uncharacterized protein DUF5906
MSGARRAKNAELDEQIIALERQWRDSPCDAATAAADEGVSLDDFRALMTMHAYIFTPARDLWPAASVNARLGTVPLLDAKGKPVTDDNGKPKRIAAAAWLDKHRPVEQMTWAPGRPMLIRNRLMQKSGWIKRAGVTCFNLYLPPTIISGDASKAGPWLDHARKVYPDDDADYIIKWCAHRVQRPHDKINHALVLGGDQGIGKDTLLEPVKRAVGPWNFDEASPQQVLARFNGFLKSVILRISEARDLGDQDRFGFYDHLKAYTAAPPDALRVDEKHLREHYVLNCVGIIITSNHKQDGIYLPADDRRHYVAWSDRKRADFSKGYWDAIWSYYNNGGDRHVAAYLASLDLSSFNAKAPPQKTPAFWAIVNANRAPEDAELADVLDRLNNPDVTTLTRISNEASGDFQTWIKDRKNRRNIPYRMENCGYVPVRNDIADDGLWKINGVRQVVYAKSTLPTSEQLREARNLTGTDQ